MKVLPIFVLLYCCLDIGVTKSVDIRPKSVENYYWRDFNGLVPGDAIIGGKDDSGYPTFIGQFTTVAEYGRERSDFHLIPAVVKRDSEVAVAPYYGRSIISNNTSNVKVLCDSYYSSRYKWYNKNSQFPTNCRFVIGGNEDRSPMYIGRAAQGREVITGKIFADTSSHTPDLLIPYQGKEVVHQNFEVLTYCN